MADKLKLFVFGLLFLIPKKIEGYFNKLHAAVKRIRSSFSVIIYADGVKYALADYSSLITVCHAEKWMWKFFRPKDGEVFIDVGAHVGKYTLRIASQLRKSLVIAIEPCPKNYQCLVKGVQLNRLKNVITLNIAAWNKDSKLKLFTGEESGYHSVKFDYGLGFIEIEAKALDDVIRGIDLRRVDWIKIDVEGAELQVLDGLKSTLEKDHPKVMLETKPENIPHVLKFLKESGYRTIKPIVEKQTSTYFYCG